MSTDDSEEQVVGRQAQWRLDNPQKYRAHLAVSAALRRGALVKLPCKVCGNPRTDAHHPDYRRPLTVVWLCRFHHSLAHRREKQKT